MSTPEPPRPAGSKKTKKAPKADKGAKPVEAGAEAAAVDPEAARKAEQRRLQQCAWLRACKSAAKGKGTPAGVSVPKKLLKEVAENTKKSLRRADAAKGGAGGGSATPGGRFEACWICGQTSACVGPL